MRFLDSLIIRPFKGLVGISFVIALVAGGAAVGAFIYIVFSTLGLVLGFTVGGAPVIVDSYHSGQAQMDKIVAAHGGTPHTPTASAAPKKP